MSGNPVFSHPVPNAEVHQRRAPLPFPTPDESIRLVGAYDSSETRGYLSAYHFARLAKKMGVTVTSIRRWFADERMRQGHYTGYTKYPHRHSQEEGQTFGGGGEDTATTAQREAPTSGSAHGGTRGSLDP